MTRHRIRHVVLVEEGRPVGVVSSRDFLALQTTHPVTLAREITRAVSLDALAQLAGRVTDPRPSPRRRRRDARTTSGRSSPS